MRFGNAFLQLSIILSGTSRVFSSVAPAAPAAAATAPIDVNGDGADPSSSVGDDATTRADDDHVAAPISNWSPQTDDMASYFKDLVGLDSDVWDETKRLGPPTTNVVRRWTTPSSGFRPTRRDPSLTSPFDKLSKENKPLYDFVMATLSSAFATAHAASHAAAFMGEFMESLPTIHQGEAWEKFASDMTLSMRDNVIFPLRDSVICMAGIAGKSVASIRAGVIKHANDAVKSVLHAAPPSNDFFFGNPSSDIKDSLNFAMMDSLIARPKAAAPKPFARRPATAAPRAAAPAAASASTSKDDPKKGNYGRRSNRGRGGGRK